METITYKIEGTKTLFESKEQYLKFVEAWKESFNTKETREKLSSYHFALYRMFRNRDWTKAFTPVTKRIRLENGHHPYHSLASTLYTIQSQHINIDKLLWPFNGYITEDMIKKLRLMIPESNYHVDQKIKPSPYREVK